MTYMSTKSADVKEFSYPVPDWLWKQRPHSVLRNARIAARRRRMRADGEPIVHVVLVWPQEETDSAA